MPTDSDPNRSGVDVPGLADDWNSMALNDFRVSDTTSLNLAVEIRTSEQWYLRACYAHLDYQVDMLFSGNFGMSNDFPLMQGRRVKHTIYANSGDTFEVDATGTYRVGFLSLRLLFGAQYIDRQFKTSNAQAPNDPAVGPIASPLPNWDLGDSSTWDRTGLPLSALTAGKTEQTTKFRDEAVHAGATVGLFDDRLLLLAGVRLTQAESQLVDTLTHVAGTQFSAHKFTPQFGALGRLPFGLSVFYSESFVPGSQVLLVRNVATVPAQPTQGRGVDVGVKAELFGGRVSGTVTAFEVWNTNIVNDIAELDPSTGATSGSPRSPPSTTGSSTSRTATTTRRSPSSAATTRPSSRRVRRRPATKRPSCFMEPPCR